MGQGHRFVISLILLIITILVPNRNSICTLCGVYCVGVRADVLSILTSMTQSCIISYLKHRQCLHR